MINNSFDTFAEAKAAQDYDFNLFCAKKFAALIKIDLQTILDLGLHLEQHLRHEYYEANGIDFTEEENTAIHDLVNNLNGTDRWANIFLYQNKYIYLSCPDSDKTYNTIENINNAELKALNDDGVYIPATDWGE